MAPQGAPKAKAVLKAIMQSIKNEKYTEAVHQATALLDRDNNNYQGHIFLAFSLDKLKEVDKSEIIYKAAIKLKPEEHQAWAGLVALYESQGSEKIPDYHIAVEKLTQIYANGGDDLRPKAHQLVVKFIEHARTQGTKAAYLHALSLVLPDRPLYSLLDGQQLPHPAQTYETMAQLTDAEDNKLVAKLIGERRTRIGARLADVTEQTKREVFAKSQLEHLYRQLINWTTDDEKRRSYEEKLLRYCYDRLLSAPKASKMEELAIVQKLAEGMVIIRHPFKLAWDIVINWKDGQDISDWDVNILREYCSLFPESDLYRVVASFLTSKISPFPQKAEAEPSAPAPATSDDGIPSSDSDSDDDDGGGVPTEVVPVSDEDRLLMMTDGIASANSLFAYRLMGEYYQHLEEHESNVELMRKALLFLKDVADQTGLRFSNTKDAFNVHLGTALVFHQTPRHHKEAKTLFETILRRNPSSTSAMIGVGMIFEEEEDYDAAVDFLDRALQGDKANIRLRSEAAWVKSLKGDYTGAMVGLEECIQLIRQGELDKIAKQQLALSQYRLGVCIWNIDPSKAARKSRKGAYALFLDALKNDINLAPAYTMLGVYFSDYTKDTRRARRCFQQAVELSSSEIAAAERLARSFADEGSWEHVELIAQRVIDSGKAKPPPGSKKKGTSWPFSALGVAQLNKQDFSKSVVSFQAALRMSPDNYNAWVGLGESYANSGRYVAATKAILQAQTLEEPQKLGDQDTWFTKYMLANIKRELSEYDESTALYRVVLGTHPDEEGVAIALMQTLIESGFASVARGFFGKAADLSSEVLKYAATAPPKIRNTFNYWKAVGDACALFSRVQSRLGEFPVNASKSLVKDCQTAHSILSDVDGVDSGVVNADGLFPDDETRAVALTRCLHASLLAFKMAIHVSAQDIHAQAVAYYNLGWAEHRAHVCLPGDIKMAASNYLKAAVQCFKRAIELESGNSEFWTAFGVATSQTHPRVAQHAFVRSLRLDEKSPVAWANYATLALMHHDVDFAGTAFKRAQSSDPDYAPGWVGQGLVDLLQGKAQDASVRFKHAVELANSSHIPAKRYFAASTFDHILSVPDNVDITTLVLPLFALNQLKELDPRNTAYAHLGALFQERIHDYDRARTQLQSTLEVLETDYTSTKSASSHRRSILVKVDLARMQMQTGHHDAAIESATSALSGLDQANSNGDKDELSRAHLSANITMGLAHYHSGRPQDAVKHLKAANHPDKPNSDTACILAQVLWATDTEEARDEARDVLFEIVAEEPEHIPAVLQLGAIAHIDEDKETAEAVAETLLALRTSQAANTPALRRDIAEVLSALAGDAQEGTAEAGKDATDEVRIEAQTETMLYPNLPHGWAALVASATASTPIGKGGDDVDEKDARYAAEMAVKVALRSMPPRGRLAPEALAVAMAGMGRAADGQTAIMVAPWEKAGWNTLATAVAGVKAN